ncbi:hypothetical protein EIN_218690 [Entamoeba invadens IP1]|uniref:Uncharacterized protein n=1 Tax=Entamoeba invadens IP1 TaxID=370355 RepID=L7FLT4_ENTIV|nr:hypothetical protein EIN_218690 [Entamoeba invadens IP1]ELP89537.1 hypothetical protein EIN_218690 [Entamoeba invadens IP1]|eukprot:XP_004256308.1 hypothetical protein EIN_218690 [Entamoeba invadens IP1]
MTRLEPFYLRNVVLYLPTLSDLINFVCINKKSCDVSESLYINPFNLPQSIPIQKIVTLFPKLETLYLPYEVDYNLSFLENLGTFIIELRRNYKTPKSQGPSKSVTSLLSTEWFPKRVRKLRIFEQEVHTFADNISKYVQLKTVTFGFKGNDCMEDFMKIITHKTLRTVTFSAAAYHANLISAIDFSDLSDTQFNIQFFAAVNSELSIEDVQKLSKLPPNVCVYISYLSDIILEPLYKTKNITYLPFLSEKELYRTVTKVLNKNLNDKNLFSFIQKALPKELQVVKDFTQQDDKTSVIKVDFTNLKEEFCMEIVVLQEVRFVELIMPKTVKILKMKSVEGAVKALVCKLEDVKIIKHGRDKVEIECENVKKYKCDRSRVDVMYKGKKYLNTFFMAVGEGLSYDISVTQTSKLVFLRKGEKVGQLVFCGKVCLNDTTFVVNDVKESFDLSRIHNNEINTFKINEMRSSPFKLKFGEVQNVKIMGNDENESYINTIHFDKIERMKLSYCCIEQLKGNELTNLDSNDAFIANQTIENYGIIKYY